jgi:deoxyribodipyrimidine photo-lyase
MYKRTVFMFRRDLRINDNIGLIKALEQSEVVIPCFIVDPRQVGNQNRFKSDHALEFMIHSLEDLTKQLEAKKGVLYLFEGMPHKVLQNIIDQVNIDAVFCNRDYTPFSFERDEAIKKVCLRAGIAFEQCNDYLLIEPEALKTTNNTPYTIFSPFFKKAQKHAVAMPTHARTYNFFSGPLRATRKLSSLGALIVQENRSLVVKGGRAEGLLLLKKIKTFKDYSHTRDFPSIATTHLSAHNKFGTVSIREVYHVIANNLGKEHPLIRQLYWRDFFTHIAYHSPFVFGSAYHKKYNNLSWRNTKKEFAAWCEGKTGFPIVDAGMRQLNKTGFMHNRVRMITASFLVKDLHIDWQWGEQYFAQKLVDYDPSVNNGNWQWVASTGCDAQPYFRIFNPWLQQKKFDPNCIYIKQWVPELKTCSTTLIHNWYKTQYEKERFYIRPMVDHTHESTRAKQMYQNVQ